MCEGKTAIICTSICKLHKQNKQKKGKEKHSDSVKELIKWNLRPVYWFVSCTPFFFFHCPLSSCIQIEKCTCLHHITSSTLLYNVFATPYPHKAHLLISYVTDIDYINNSVPRISWHSLVLLCSLLFKSFTTITPGLTQEIVFNPVYY